MHRRPLLAAIAGGTVLLTGCLGRRRGPGDEPAESSTDDPTATDGGRALAVDRVETFSHALRLNDLGRSPTGEVPRASELDAREREVVVAAVDGGYRTEDLPTWLARFLARTRHVLVDGTAYRLRADLPSTRIDAEPVDEAEVDGPIASTDEYRTAVRHDGVVMTGLLREARRGGITLADVWPSLREFLAEYDAVRYRGAVLAVETTRRDPGPPYAVTAEAASLSELANGPVWDAADALRAVRSVLREAGTTEGLFPLNDPPEGLIENLDDHEYVHLDGRFYTTYVEKRGSLPVSLSARFVDPAPDGDARIRIELESEADRPLRVTSGAPAPLGVLHYHPVGSAGDRRLLWTEAYAESDHVRTEGHEVTGWNSIAVVTRLAPGESVAREFLVEETSFPAGGYVVAGDVGVSPADAEGGTFPYRIHFDVA